ncbi:MAG: hypothetical protein ABL921_10470 [Pirellula sp.]
MQKLTRRAFLSGLFAMQLFFVGCGGESVPTAAVEGTVKLDGKPLDRILVEFWPDAGGPRSMGETDAAGKFKLASEDGKGKGAVVGSHKVVLKDTAALGDKFLGREGEEVDMSKGKKPRISGKFASQDASPFNKKVEAGKTNQFDFDVTK